MRRSFVGDVFGIGHIFHALAELFRLLHDALEQLALSINFAVLLFNMPLQVRQLAFQSDDGLLLLVGFHGVDLKEKSERLKEKGIVGDSFGREFS